MTEETTENRWWDGLKADDACDLTDQIKAAFDTKPVDMQRIIQLWYLFYLLNKREKIEELIKYIQNDLKKECEINDESSRTLTFIRSRRDLLEKLKAVKDIPPPNGDKENWLVVAMKPLYEILDNVEHLKIKKLQERLQVLSSKIPLPKKKPKENK